MENPDPVKGAYVLKFLQAAVALGAREIDIKITRKELTLTFSHDGDELSDLGAVLEQVERPAVAAVSPLGYLVAGLRAARREARETLWQSPRGTLKLTASAGDMDGLSSVWKYRLVVRKARPLWRWFLGVLFFEELACVRQRCRFIPARLVLDSREVTRHDFDRFDPIPLQFGLARPHFLMDFRLREGHDIWLGYPDKALYLESEHSKQRQIWNGDKARVNSIATVPLLIDGWDGTANAVVPAGGAVGLPSAAQGSGRWIPVCHGVQLDPVEADLGLPGVRVIMAANDLPTEGLRVLSDERLEARLEQARRAVRQAREALGGAELRRALGIAGLPAEERDPVVELTMRAHSGEIGVELSRLLAAVPPDVNFLVGSEVAGTWAGTHRPIFGLRCDEVWLAFYNDSLLCLGGIAVTDRRICWKSALGEPTSLYWHELSGAKIGRGVQGMDVWRFTIDLCLGSDELKEGLVRFVREAAKLDWPAAYERTEAEARVLAVALRTVGKVSPFSFYPHLDEKLVESLRVFHGGRWPRQEKALVVCDRSPLKPGEEGWVATERRLLWSDPRQRHPDMVEWGAFAAGEVSLYRDIESYDFGVWVGPRKIRVPERLCQSLADFLAGMARRDIRGRDGNPGYA